MAFKHANTLRLAPSTPPSDPGLQAAAASSPRLTARLTPPLPACTRRPRPSAEVLTHPVWWLLPSRGTFIRPLGSAFRPASRGPPRLLPTSPSGCHERAPAACTSPQKPPAAREHATGQDRPSPAEAGREQRAGAQRPRPPAARGRTRGDTPKGRVGERPCMRKPAAGCGVTCRPGGTG